jgi:tetratricopeptide (TPR) repeat protein
MKQLVITVHGISTFGRWEGRIADLLRQQATDEKPTVIEYKFGFFSIFAFMFPFLRMLVVRRFRKYFVRIATNAAWDRVDLVGHSFGTHIIAWALHGIDSAKRPPVDTIILAGSVLKTNFPWQDLIGRSVRRVINDCGTKDEVLILNQIAILGTGMAGRLGFNGGIGENFRNRFFDCGHSGYFLTSNEPDDAFMREYWVPLLLTDQPPQLVDRRKDRAQNGFVLWLLNNSDPVKLFFCLAPFVLLSIYFYHLNNEAVTQRNNAEAKQKQVEENLLTTQRLLRAFSDVVAERIRPIASLDEVDLLIKQATNLIGSVQRSDPGIAIPYAEMLLTEADVKWERRETQEMYNLGKQAIAALAQSDKNRPEVQHLLARANCVIGLYFVTTAATESGVQKMHNDLENARSNYNSALAQLVQLGNLFDQVTGTTDAENDWRWLRSLGFVQMAMGDLLLTGFGNADEASKNYQQSHDTWTKLSEVRPDDAEVTFELDWTDNKLGDVLRAQGQDVPALRQFEKAEREIRGLIDQIHFDQRWLYYLAIVQVNIGVKRTNLEQYEEAIVAFQKAETALKRLLSYDAGQNSWQATLAWTWDNIGETKVRWARKTRDASKLQEADVVLDEARRSLAPLATHDPQWASELAFVRANIAGYDGTKKELAQDCGAAASSYVRAADGINSAAVKGEREDSAILRKAEFLEWAAIDYRNLGNTFEAEDKLREALTIIKDHVPKFSGGTISFSAMKQRLERELQANGQPAQGICN